jgi:carbon-monoxide dehydrogenase iron sulfur subunit
MRHNYGVINRERDTGEVIKCDLCQGREMPACVEACPTHALVYSEIKDFQV